MELKNKTITLMFLTSLVVGNTIGAGIFVLPVSPAYYGSISLIFFPIVLFIAIFIALFYSYLSYNLSYKRRELYITAEKH